ncbi:MAG: glycosyltransferase family 1 protein, partial [Pseudomonadota bacterium]
VVRSVLGVVLRSPPEGFTVELVYASTDAKGYRYARNFKHRFLGIAETWSEDAPVDAWAGDMFFGLDLNPSVVIAQREQLAQWHSHGVGVQFLVHDLLPVLQPQYFHDGTQAQFQEWLNTISRFDGVICVSRTVADEMYEWLQTFAASRERAFKLNWSHNGADLENSSPTLGLPDAATPLAKTLKAHPTFVMVGTVEPRKGHAQALAAFEQLWDAGSEAILVIVGKQGWKVDELVGRLRAHPQLDRCLYWLENISDEYLDLIYAASSCLLAASEGEGYGLPLVEAARRGCPILARDIPVFREVAGSGASYFPDNNSPAELAAAITAWLAMSRSGSCPDSSRITWRTWEESAGRMMSLLFEDKPYRAWTGDNVHRFWGSDPRLSTRVGSRQGKHMRTSGQAGHLIFGPYLPLAAGIYEISMSASAALTTGGEFVDVVIDQGRRELAQENLQVRNDGVERTFRFSIRLDAAADDLEVRLWVADQTEMSLAGFEIRRAEDPDAAPGVPLELPALAAP